MVLEYSYTIDNLIENKKNFLGKWVKTRGILIDYKIGSGIHSLVELKIEGKRWGIGATGMINRAAGEYERLNPYLEINKDKEIGPYVYSDSYKFVRLYFPTKIFNFNY